MSKVAKVAPIAYPGDKKSKYRMFAKGKKKRTAQKPLTISRVDLKKHKIDILV